MTKQLDILLIEDNEKHLADAQAEAQKRIAAGEIGNVDFSGVYEQVLDMIKAKRYDGIITDIFFPGDTSEGISGKMPAGWSSAWRSECYRLLKDFGVNYSIGRRDEFSEKIVKAADEWMDSRSMHPSGVLVVEKALEAGIPIVMCTDTYHHGYSTQPVFVWAGSKGVRIVDSHGKYEGNASFKDWSRAFSELMEKIKSGEKA
jgi:hypothetical protein